MSGNDQQLRLFLEESNRIEGIYSVSETEIEAAQWFLDSHYPSLYRLSTYVKVTAPHAVLRDQEGLNVRVGNYVAPFGSPYIRKRLEELLKDAAHLDPWKVHVEYELLHPFTDGNGRSGRLLWLWTMKGHAPLGFLHHFYYQTLERQG